LRTIRAVPPSLLEPDGEHSRLVAASLTGTLKTLYAIDCNHARWSSP
jgi:hypothetical protein